MEEVEGDHCMFSGWSGVSKGGEGFGSASGKRFGLVVDGVGTFPVQLR